MTDIVTHLTVLRCAIGLLAFIVGAFYYMLILPEKRLKQWAAKKEVELLWFDDAQFSESPLLQGTTGIQHLFHVRIRTQAGAIRSGYVRCGTPREGLLCNYSEEFLDDAK